MAEGGLPLVMGVGLRWVMLSSSDVKRSIELIVFFFFVFFSLLRL